MKLACSVLAASIVACAAPARAASFDCAKAATRVEKAICADPALGRLDTDIAAAYGALSAGLDPAMRKRLLRSQREWLSHREAGRTLADDMKGRLALLRAKPVPIGAAAAFLRLADDSRPMFVIGAAPGAEAYDRWVDSIWDAAANDASPAEADKEQADCVAQAADDRAKGDCMAESETRLYRTIVAAPGILGVVEDLDEIDQHALRPSVELHHYNWWLSRSGRVTAADMFAGEGYKALVARAVHAGVQAQCGEENQDEIDRLSDPDSWGLTDKALALSADGYSFACGRGEIEVDIPWSDLRPVLRPEFAKALGLR